jgi:hypothetical protein
MLMLSASSPYAHRKRESFNVERKCKRIHPSFHSLIQLGIWDGSHEHQDWSHGPINVSFQWIGIGALNKIMFNKLKKSVG